jgi:hypothetical protein
MGQCKDHNGRNLSQLDYDHQLNTWIIINQMEYQEYILLKAVDQDGLVQSIITQILINN